MRRSHRERVAVMPEVPKPLPLAAPEGMEAAQDPLIIAHQTSEKEVIKGDRFDPARRSARRVRMARVAVYGPAHMAGRPMPAARLLARRHQQRAHHTPRHNANRPGTYRTLT